MLSSKNNSDKDPLKKVWDIELIYLSSVRQQILPSVRLVKAKVLQANNVLTLEDMERNMNHIIKLTTGLCYTHMKKVNREVVSEFQTEERSMNATGKAQSSNLKFYDLQSKRQNVQLLNIGET